MPRIGVVLLALLAVGPLAQAQTEADCETLAAALSGPPEPDALDAAREACSAAARAEPENTRILHLYARTLELSGNLAAATRLYQWGADDGYAPAAEALSRLTAAADAAPQETVEATADETQPPEAEPSVTDTAEAESSETDSDRISPETAARLAETASGLERIAALLDAARGQLDRSRFDPAAVVAEVGTDPAALAGWVAANTALVPYQGRLRGPSGVLMDRLGNSLDRSLLLAALLETAGHRVQLVHGTLPAEQAAQLLARPDVPATTAAAAPAAIVSESEADALGLTHAFREGAQAAADARATVVADARAQGTALLELIASSATPVSDRDRQVEALADHWWVRVQSPGGGLDLDPSAVSDHAIELAAAASDTLSPELSHAVAFTVDAEFIEPDGSLRTAPLLDRVLYPADTIGSPVMLWHEPVGQAAEALLVDGDWPAATEALIDERAWQPVLLVGREVFAGRIVTLDGEVLDGDAAGIAAARLPLPAMTSAIDMMEDLPGGDPQQAAGGANLVALWLDFEITAPGMPPIRHRRAVFDLVGAEAREAGVPLPLPIDDASRRLRAEALLEQIDIGIWGATPPAAYVAEVTARDLSPLFAAVAGRLRTGPAAAAELPVLGDIPRSLLLPYAFAAGRTGLAGGGTAILDHPNLLLARHGVRLGAEPSTATLTFDIVENGVAQVGAPPGGAFAARLRQGVADTAFEAALLGSPSPSANAAVRYAGDLAAGRTWVALSGATSVDDLDIPADAAASIRAAVAQGYLAVAPAAAPPDGIVAWWRIDPATGTTLGIGPTGAGSEFVEYLSLLGKFVGVAGCAASGYGAIRGIDSVAEAAATGVAAAACFAGLGLSILSSVAKIMFVTTPMTEAAIAANAAAWAGPDAIGALVAAGGGLVLTIVGL